MAQIPYRANLSATAFPLTLAKAGRSVIFGGPDQNYDKRVDPAQQTGDPGIPQLMYAEDVVPTPDGYQSIGYVKTTGISFVGKTITIAKEVFVGDGTTKTPAIFYNDGTSNITFVGAANTPLTEFSISSAVVRGVSYAIVNFDYYTVTFVGVNLTFTNITAAMVGAPATPDYLTSAYNYLIVQDGNTIHWSSSTTPTDFTVSLVSGAGSESINNAGSLQFLAPVASGFIVFTTANAFLATYTGNSRYPWKFRPINGSKIVRRPSQVWSSGDAEEAYVIENNSQVKIYSGTDTGQILSPITDILERVTVYDEFDSTTNTFSAIPVESFLPGTDTFFKLTFCNARYLIISYQPTDSVGVGPIPIFAAALVYDTRLKRYGRLKINHTHVFNSWLQTVTFPNEMLFFHCGNGEARYTYFDIYQTHDLPVSDTYETMKSVFVLGKLQYIRNRFICLDDVAIECPTNTNIIPIINRNFSAFVLPTLDGKTFLSAVPLSLDSAKSTGSVITYRSHAEGKNISLLLKGAFEINSVEATFHLGGKW